MKVSECMTTDTSVCVAESSCAAAGEIMRRRQCGFMPIVDSLKTKRIVGVVTDRDLMLHLVRQRPARHVAVKACMTKSPTTISSEASLEEAVHVMKRAAVRQLPVVDNGQFVGVLSLLDIALAVRRQWAYVGPNVTEQHVTDIIEAIAVARAATQESPRVPMKLHEASNGKTSARTVAQDGHVWPMKANKALEGKKLTRTLTQDGHALPKHLNGQQKRKARVV